MSDNNSFSKSKISTSMDNIASSPSNTSRLDMQDINNLMFLEILKRMKEDENNINRQLEEKKQQFEQTKCEYAILYEKYARLMKLTAMRSMLETPSAIKEAQLDECKENVENMLSKIKPDHIKATVNQEELISCKEKLNELAEYKNVEKQYEHLTEHKQCVDDIQKKSNNLMSILLTSTIQDLDNFVEKFQIKKK